MNPSTGGLSRRRGVGTSTTNGEGSTQSAPQQGPPSNTASKRSNEYDDESRRKIAIDPRDLEDSEDKYAPKLTLMEEVLLLGLKDKQGYLSFWNDNISYTLRGCILIELALRDRIAMIKDPQRRKYALSDRYVEVIADKLTGEVLLDEALKMMKSAPEKMSVAQWVDLMSGETWNVLKIGYQLKQVRERLAKGLVDKGILRTEKRNFLLFDMATHPLTDSSTKNALISRVCTTLTSNAIPSAIDAQSETPNMYMRTIALICASYAANVLENALVSLGHENRERAYAKVDELLGDFGGWPFQGNHGGKVTVPKGKEAQWEVVAAVLNVFTKMDSIL